LAKSISDAFDLDVNAVSRHINNYYGHHSTQTVKKSITPTTITNKGSGVEIVTDYSEKAVAIVGDTEPLRKLFTDLKYVGQGSHVKLGKIHTISKKRREEFLDMLNNVGIPHTLTTIEEYVSSHRDSDSEEDIPEKPKEEKSPKKNIPRRKSKNDSDSE